MKYNIHNFVLGLFTGMLLITLSIAFTTKGKKACDSVCNKAQCACVETCPHERK